MRYGSAAKVLSHGAGVAAVSSLSLAKGGRGFFRHLCGCLMLLVSAGAPAAAQSDDAHAALFAEDRFPSAQTCRTCHPRHYREWSVSQHAYTQVGPIFTAMQRTLNGEMSSTLGDFCVRCHTPVGMSLGESLFESTLDRQAVSQEGVTCVVCHRINTAYGRVSGRFSMVEGSLVAPVWGPHGNAGTAQVLEQKNVYTVTTNPKERGRKIHRRAERLTQLSSSVFCGVCHDVNVVSGFRVFETFSEYKSSPAAKKGTSCQDCHMGKVQGVAKGYAQAPVAVIGGKATPVRKHTNHFFAGPDHSVIHPGLFPFNPDARELASMREWLQFDYRAGWGTEDFEDEVSDDAVFPERWQDSSDREDAREIIDAQLELLAWARDKRLEVMRNAFAFGDIVTEQADRDGLRFRVEVKSTTDGHNVPSGFPERLIFLHVTVTDRTGKLVFESGDRDPNGDLRDRHSLYVHNGELSRDDQLFSLQSLFVMRNQRGGEREQVLPINYSLDPLPFVRPFPRSTVLTGEPAGARIHRKTIEPLGERIATYEVAGSALTGKGPYTANIQMVAQILPVNVVGAIMDVGFDYDLSPRALADAVVSGAEVLYEKTLTFDLSGN